MKTILSGVVGSQAYGLAGPDSDTDRIAVFAHHPVQFHGLTPPRESYTTTQPDVTRHEAAKAARLMLKCNPTVLEILWLESWEIKDAWGDELTGIRRSFLSGPAVKGAYLGYATQQFCRLLGRGGESFSSDIGPARVRKHARHMKRLLVQGVQLYTTGELTLRVDDPQAYFDFGDQVAADPTAARPLLEKAEAAFAAGPCVLRDEPSTGIVESWLRRMRRAHFLEGSQG